MKKKDIAKALTVRRKSLAVTQRDVARLAGLSLHTVCNLESGEGNPTLQSLLALADVLGLEIKLSVKEYGVEAPPFP